MNFGITVQHGDKINRKAVNKAIAHAIKAWEGDYDTIRHYDDQGKNLLTFEPESARAIQVAIRILD